MILILLLTYRSPVLWLLPIFSAVVALFTAAGAHLLPRQVRRPHRQRAEPGHPHRPGLRCRHRLRAAARRPLPRGAAPPRGPARGDGVRPAPRSPGDLRQRGTVVLGMLCLLFAEMNSTAGLGPVPAIGIAVTLLVMITLLALLVICGRWVFCRSGRRSARPSRRPPASGPGSAAGSVRPRRVWVGTGVLWPSPASALQARRQRPDHRRLVHQGVRLDHRPARAHRTPPAELRDPLQVDVANNQSTPRSAPWRCRGRRAGHDGRRQGRDGLHQRCARAMPPPRCLRCRRGGQKRSAQGAGAERMVGAIQQYELSQ